MSTAARLQYYRRVLPAYLGSGRSQLTFWHDTPEINPRALIDAQTDTNAHLANRPLGPYYMSFREKADYSGPTTPTEFPCSTIAARSAGNTTRSRSRNGASRTTTVFAKAPIAARLERTLHAADWLAANLEPNAHGLWVWNHHFDWEYRDTLKAPWYSGLAQGQGVSLLLRAHAQTGDDQI